MKRYIRSAENIIVYKSPQLVELHEYINTVDPNFNWVMADRYDVASTDVGELQNLVRQYQTENLNAPEFTVDVLPQYHENLYAVGHSPVLVGPDVSPDYAIPDEQTMTAIRSANQMMTSFQLEQLFDLADDMLYQIYDNYRYDDYSKKDIIDMVIEHVIMVITEMDDDGVYEELVPFASTKNRQFMKNIKEHVGEMYDTYEWGY